MSAELDRATAHCPVALAMGDAAGDPRRPERFALRPAADRRGRKAQPRESLARARTPGHELAAALLDRVSQGELLFGEELDVEPVLPRLDGADEGGSRSASRLIELGAVAP